MSPTPPLAYLTRAYGLGGRLCKALALAALLTGPATAQEVRLMAFGDSLVQGHGLAPDAGFVAQLRDWLATQGAGSVKVINMGVSGDTTAGGRARLDWALDEAPDAVILVLGGNDLLRGLEPAATRANLDAMLATLQARGLPVLLAGIAAPTNYGTGWQVEFDAIWPELAAARGALLVPDFLAPVRGRPGLMQEDGIHPNAAGVAAIVAAIGPQVTALLARARQR